MLRRSPCDGDGFLVTYEGGATPQQRHRSMPQVLSNLTVTFSCPPKAFMRESTFNREDSVRTEPAPFNRSVCCGTGSVCRKMDAEREFSKEDSER
eukprot:3934459-Rhodomonas_salina.1